MSEKSSFPKPISAAIGKATGVFTRPKLQRRAYTAFAPSELLSGVRLSNAVLDLKTSNQEEKLAESTAEITTNMITFSPRLTTWDADSFNLVNSIQNREQNEGRFIRRNSDTVISTEKQLNKNSATKIKVKHNFSIHCLQAKEIIKETLKSQLKNMDYSHRECGERGRIISQLIEKSIKEMSSKPYKVMALVYIGAIRDKGMELACQCIWSPEVDFFAMDTYKNETIFASGIVFATLYE